MDQQLDFLSSLFGTDAQPISLLQFAFGLAITALLSMLLGYIYIRLGRSLSNRHSLAQTLVLVSLTTMLIISIVKSSLALSLGLVGALSIVRFRTAIKEPEELAYFFMSIAIGLGIGAAQYLPTMVGCTGIFTVIYLLNLRTKPGVSQNLIIRITDPKHKDEISGIIEILDAYCQEVELRRIDDQSRHSEIALSVKFANLDKLLQLREKLFATYPDLAFSFLEIN